MKGQSSRKQTLIEWFVASAGVVLAITGLAKAWTSSGVDKIQALEDPIVGLQFHWLLLTVGMLELVISAVCCFSKNRGLAALLVALLATNFACYRFGLMIMGWHHPCLCMGTLAGSLRLSDHAADGIMKGVLVYLFLGSYGVLYVEFKRGRSGKALARPLVPA